MKKLNLNTDMHVQLAKLECGFLFCQLGRGLSTDITGRIAPKIFTFMKCQAPLVDIKRENVFQPFCYVLLKGESDLVLCEPLTCKLEFEDEQLKSFGLPFPEMCSIKSLFSHIRIPTY